VSWSTQQHKRRKQQWLLKSVCYQQEIAAHHMVIVEAHTMTPRMIMFVHYQTNTSKLKGTLEVNPFNVNFFLMLFEAECYNTSFELQ